MRRLVIVNLLFLLVIIGLACAQPDPAPTLISEPKASPPASPTTPTATPEPAASATQAPSTTTSPLITPTATQAPTPTLVPTPTLTPEPTPTPAPTATPTPPTPAQIFARISPSLAFIETPTGTGSGVLIEGGYVVTNAHVVWPFDEVRVVFPDGSEFPQAPVMNTDLMGDLAVIGPLDTKIQPLVLADREDLAIGSELFLIGYPAEAEQFPQPTITRGILSRFRYWEALEMSYFQTDAAIAGGQSGGVMVFEGGEIIGLSGFKFSEAKFGLVASAADVLPRVKGLIAGRDVSRLGDRKLPLDGGSSETLSTLDTIWDTGVYVVNNPPGETIDLKLDSENNLSLSLIDLFGNSVIEADNGFTGIESGSAKTTLDVPHFALVNLSELNSEASFKLSSNRGLAAFNDPDDGKTIVVGQTIQASMDYPRDHDYFLLDLEEDETVDITVNTVNFDPFLQIDYHQATGEVSDDDSGGGIFGTNAGLIFRAPQSAIYTLVVSDATFTRRGGYFIDIRTASPDAEPFPIAPPAVKVASPFGPMELYESRQYPFLIEHPAGWKIATEQEGLTAQFTGTGGISFGIAEEDLSASGFGKLTLSEYVDVVVSLVERNVGFDLLSRQEITTPQGIPAVVLDMSLFNGQIRVRRYVVVYDDTIGFNAGYLAPQAKFQELAPLADYSFGTFRIEGLPVFEATPVPTPTPRSAPTVAPIPSPVPTATRILATAVDLVGAKSAYLEGTAFGKEGDHEKAIEKLDEAIRLDPQYAFAYNNRGISYSNLEQYQRAIYDYDEAIRIDPQYGNAYSNRGNVYRRLGQHHRAIEDYDEAIRLNPDKASYYNNRGNAYADLGQYQQALKDHTKAIELEPSALRYNNRGIAYTNLGQYGQALKDYDEAIRLDPRYAIAHANRALAYALLGMDTEAEQDVERAVELGFDRATLELDVEVIKGQR